MYDKTDFFRFTRGRFVQNETYEMASRYVQFDVTELAKTAAQAVGSKCCTHMHKFAEGMHNKAFLLTMDDGKEVISKIPNPNAGRAHYTTASEVATMDFMRTVLRIPVPEVSAWCSHAENSSVRAEYIIMEKAVGVPLISRWNILQLADKFAIAKEIARFQRAWSSTSFEGYGSIYYTSDAPEDHRLPLQRGADDAIQKFAVGPITGRDWIDEGRQFVDFDRGPWSTLEDYLDAVGEREMACVKKMPHLPATQVTLCGPGTYCSTRAKKLRALGYYLELHKYLAPSDPAIRKPSAWHGDLHVENIYVDPTNPTTITSIIDWQSTEIAPLFLQARQPHLLDYNGPRAEGLDRPRRPGNFAKLSPEEQKAANRLLLDQSLWVAFRRWTQGRNPDIWKCFEFQETPAFELLQLAGTLLVDGEAIYAARIIEHLQSNDNILRSSGLTIPEDIVSEVRQDSEGALRGMEAMTMVQEALGDLFPERGCVRLEQYDAAKDALRQCKEQIIDMFAQTDADRAAWQECWPFDD